MCTQVDSFRGRNARPRAPARPIVYQMQQRPKKSRHRKADEFPPAQLPFHAPSPFPPRSKPGKLYSLRGRTRFYTAKASQAGAFAFLFYTAKSAPQRPRSHPQSAHSCRFRAYGRLPRRYTTGIRPACRSRDSRARLEAVVHRTSTRGAIRDRGPLQPSPCVDGVVSARWAAAARRSP